MALQILILAAVLFVIPVVVGGIFAGIHESATGILFRWVSGQMCLWAGFQIICVPFILREKNLSDVEAPFWVYIAAMILLAVGMDLKRLMRARHIGDRRWRWKGKGNIVSVFLWCCVAGLLLIQLVSACFLAYEEGDDAYYVAVSTVTEEADTMYRVQPYTGLATGLDARHSLSPMPIWVAFLARVSGIRAVVMAQILLPVVLIVMGYGIFWMIGRMLFSDRTWKLPLFLILMESLVMFGGYSVYTAENFLLVRTAQGKAILADIVIPFLFLLLLVFLEKLQADKKIGFGFWMALSTAMTAGCLCSLQGALLACMLIGIVCLCAMVSYHKWRILLPMIGCCVVPACYAFLFFVVGS